ncbi:MAG: hypothetical protein H6843_16840 [Rhodospirillaceae bacterium]|nr:hypothetical protein [Rhodospirillaceae bacterium]
MNEHGERITRAKLIDGKVYVEQPDGSLAEMQGQTDWARLDALTDEDIERMAAEDPDDVIVPEGAPYRIVKPPLPAK